MVWDASKSPGDLITSSDWNDMVTDQKGHVSRHESGGTDELSVSGLSGDLADAQDPKSHASSHSDGGSDELDAADLAGGLGTSGQLLQTDGSAVSWVDFQSGSDVSDDGSLVVSAPSDVNFGENLDVTDDGDDTVTVDGGGSTFNRFVLSEDGTVEEFFMDSSTTSIYRRTQLSGSVEKLKEVDTVFAAPSAETYGVGVDSNDCIWNAATFANSIYQLTQGGSIIDKIPTPTSSPTGVGVDSNECIWNGGFSAGSIYQLDQSGSIITQFASPSDRVQGVGVDSNDCIWHSDKEVESIYQTNQSGSIITQFDWPVLDNAYGLGVDSNDCIWTGRDDLYQYDHTGSLITYFASPGGNTTGVGLDSTDSIWNADRDTSSIYQLDQTGSIIYSETVGDPLVDVKGPSTVVKDADGSFAEPNSFLIGVEADSNNSIWTGGLTGDVYKLDRTGSITSSFAVNSTFANPSIRTVGFDSNDCLWVTENNTKSVYQLDLSGSIVTRFNPPVTGLRGVGVDGGDCVWVVEINNDSFYQLNQSGSAVTGFSAPGTTPVALDFDSNDCIWHVDEYYKSQSIYQLNQSGSVITQFSSPSDYPVDIAVDSTECIWVADFGTQKLYNLDQTGSVTEIKGEETVDIVSSRSSSQVYLDGDYSGDTLSVVKANDNVERVKLMFQS